MFQQDAHSSHALSIQRLNHQYQYTQQMHHTPMPQQRRLHRREAPQRRLLQHQVLRLQLRHQHLSLKQRLKIQHCKLQLVHSQKQFKQRKVQEPLRRRRTLLNVL